MAEGEKITEGMTLAQVTPEQANIPFDVIMPTHNRLDLTLRALRALYQNTVTPFHLIVVDDSTDMTPFYFKQLKKERDNITFIHSDKPYESGNQIFNTGLKEAKHEFVATVMNSTTVEPDWELIPLQLMRTMPDIGIVGMKCLFAVAMYGYIESAGIAMNGYTPVDIGKYLPGHRCSNTYEVMATQWAFALLRKKAVVGNLAEDIFCGFKGWDDIDNCFVLRSKGWKVYYCGLGVGFHDPRATRGVGPDDKVSHEENRRNGEIFYKRWGYWDMYKKANPTAPEYYGWSTWEERTPEGGCSSTKQTRER